LVVSALVVQLGAGKPLMKRAPRSAVAGERFVMVIEDSPPSD
jgi:hypothetical protein